MYFNPLAPAASLCTNKVSTAVVYCKTSWASTELPTPVTKNMDVAVTPLTTTVSAVAVPVKLFVSTLDEVKITLPVNVEVPEETTRLPEETVNPLPKSAVPSASSVPSRSRVAPLFIVSVFDILSECCKYLHRKQSSLEKIKM